MPLIRGSNRTRCHLMQIYLLPSEHEIIKQSAKRLGMTVSAFVRKQVLGNARKMRRANTLHDDFRIEADRVWAAGGDPVLARALKAFTDPLGYAYDIARESMPPDEPKI